MDSMKSSARLRPMTRRDIPLGMRLKTAAGWNQQVADWEMLVRAGTGWVAMVDDTAVGTATVVPYDGFSWVGMVLVDPAYRRRGIGTALLKAAIAYAQHLGAVGLDATPQGRTLYAGLGFEDVYGITRLVRAPVTSDDVMQAVTLSPAADDIHCRRVRGDLFPDLLDFDAGVFGAPRRTILESLWRRTPKDAYVAYRDGRLVGYCMGRPGSRFHQIGPVVAHDPRVAQTLLSTMLADPVTGPMVMDVPTAHETWTAFLSELGFIAQRSFTRMFLGSPPAAQPAYQFAIAGPEIG